MAVEEGTQRWVMDSVAKHRLGTFFKMEEVSRQCAIETLEGGDERLLIQEVRKDPKTGERQRLSYALDFKYQPD